ncbi:hypothetical protein [Syntrophus aciditrophicus]|jgi:capsid protein|uniref:hypothetical protein n=1 Tax=Syntrophus aciditrophicus TaxID=316277 RepID=UPI0002F5BB56|nr:hypothetical protein [Syntrophus aciditrophicus]OPY18585.1 MAG: hypothetical protein A4E74_00522 [Syntrophus sp. PtaB.Bin075]
MKEEELEIILKLLEENGLMENLADCRKQGIDPKDIVREMIARSEEMEEFGW